jgi:hypothetical protein
MVVDGETSGLATIQLSDNWISNQPFLRRFLISNFTDKWLLSYNEHAFENPTEPRDLQALVQRGIGYLILHPRLYGYVQGSDAANAYLQGLASRGWLAQIYVDKEIIVYKITLGLFPSP